MSSSAFEALTNEESEDSDRVQPLHRPDFSIEELERHCIEYHIKNKDRDWMGIIDHVKAALGYKEHEQRILTLSLAQHTIHLSNALQAYADHVQVSDPTCARHALRLLVKHVKRGGQIPHNTFVSERFLVHGRDATCMGGFSDVFCARSKSGDFVAIKRIRLTVSSEDKPDIMQRLYREALIWRQLKHQFVLPFIGVDCFTFPDYPCLVSPWMSRGTLLDFVKKNSDNGSERLRLIHESACGVEYLHKSGVVHGDIRATNIFMSYHFHAQLADFGLSGIGDTVTSVATTTASRDGSARWMSPELHDPESFGVEFKRTRASDMYAFGGLALEVITGLQPFSDVRSNASVCLKIVQGTKPAKWPLAQDKSVPRAVWDEIDRCWSTDASSRPSAHSLMKVLEDESPSITNGIHKREVQEQRAFEHVGPGEFEHAHEVEGSNRRLRRFPPAESVDRESSGSGHGPTQTAAHGSKKRQRSEEDVVAGKRQRKAERVDSRVLPKSQRTSVASTNPKNVEPDLKKGEDWVAEWNPKAKRVLDVELLHTLEHESEVTCVRFSTDGKYLATGCKRIAQIFDVKTGVKVCELIHKFILPDCCILSVWFSPDGKFLATGGDSRIRIWDIAQKKIAKIFDGHKRGINSLEFSRDGQLLVSGSADYTVRVWDMSTADSSPTHILNTNSWVCSVAISSDGRLVASGSLSPVVYLWDVQSGTLVEELRGHKNAVNSVAFTPDGRGLVSGSSDKTLKYWDIRPVMARIGGHRDPALKDNNAPSACAMNLLGHKDYVSSVAVSADGQWVVSASDDHSVQVWDAHTATLQFMLQGHKNWVNSVEVNPVGGMLVSGSKDGRARIWKLTAV